MLEAVWLKDDEEIYLVSPVLEIRASVDLSSVEVYNGYYWYSQDDCKAVTGLYPNGFTIRTK